jgi:hypothetical protein
MEVGKVIENVVIFGGIGAMAYLLLKKNPVIEQGATTKNFINGIEESEYKKLLAEGCAKNVAFSNNPAQIRECRRLQEKNELTDSLLDESVVNDYNSNTTPYTDMWNPPPIKSLNTCNELDNFIKSQSMKLQFFYSRPMDSRLPDWIGEQNEKAKAEAEAKFNKYNCRDKIEAVRTKTLVDLQTKGSIKAEETIVNKGFTEQKTYIILGALVLLTGFYVVVKK